MYKNFGVIIAAAMTACTINLDLTAERDFKAAATDPDKVHSDDASAATEGEEGKNVGDAEEHGTVSADEGGDASLYVLNLSSDAICWVYADPCGEESNDLLGDDVLPSDWYLTVDGLEEGCHDMWAFPCVDDGSFWYGRYNLPNEFTWILTDGAGAAFDTGGDGGSVDTDDGSDDTDALPGDTADDTADTGSMDTFDTAFPL